MRNVLYLFLHHFNTPMIEAEYLMKQIQYEKDPFLRKMLFQFLLKTDLNISELAQQFLRDKYPANRLLALQFLSDNKTDTAINLSVRMLLDRNSQVRALARNIVLQDKRQFDIHQYYLDNLSTDTVVSLCSLGEVGSQEDCNLIEQYLSDNCNSIVRAAMTALLRLDSSTYVLRITEMLSSKYSSIVKTAVSLLKKYEIYDFERIFQIQDCSSNENTKIKCVSLLFLSTKWKSLIYILMLLGSGYEKLESLCQSQLNRWMLLFN